MVHLPQAMSTRHECYSLRSSLDEFLKNSNQFLICVSNGPVIKGIMVACALDKLKALASFLSSTVNSDQGL